MLRPIAWANSIALTTVIFYLVMMVIGFVSPQVFTMIYKAQYLGANIQMGAPTAQEVITTLVVLLVTGWIFGYVWAALYNKLAK